MILKNSNISIIIETDHFDYDEFRKTWGHILSDIRFNVKSVYFYVHRHNKFSQSQKINTISFESTKKSLLQMKAKNISFPRVIISDLPDNGYLPLMISSYTDDMYPLQAICYIDARNINYKSHISNLIYSHTTSKNLLAQWIEKSYEMHLRDPSLASVFGFQTQITINEDFLPKNYNGDSQSESAKTDRFVQKKVGCDIVMVKESIVRELLYYTKSSIDSPTPFLTLSLIDDHKVHNSYDNLISSNYIHNVDFYPFSQQSRHANAIATRPLDHFKCPGNIAKNFNNVTFSVFIPCFKRNYFDQILSIMDNQTMQPSYYVLVQNRFYKDIDVEGELIHYLNNNIRPIYKVWMTNYNSFFVLPNLVTSLLNTDFVFRYDDDHIPQDDDIFSRALRREFILNTDHDTIIGDRLSILNIMVGNFHNEQSIRINCRGGEADYVASPYLYRPRQMKLSGRMKPLFLAGGEDAHFGLSAAIQCDTISKYFPFKVKDYSGDMYRHGIDQEIRNYIHTNVHYSGHLIHNVYAYYVKIGLKPKCWRNFELDPRDRIDGAEYMHTTFF